MARRPPVDPVRRARRWRWVRRLAGLAALAVGVLALALLGAWVWLQSPSGNRWLKGQAEAQVSALLVPGATFSVGGLRTDLLSRVLLTDVAFEDDRRHTVLAAERIEVRYGLLGLLGRHLRVRSLEVEALVVDLEVDDDGATSLHRLFGPPDPDAPPGAPWSGLPIDITVGRVDIARSSVRYATPDLELAVAEIGLGGTVRLVGPRVGVEGLTVGGRLVAPEHGAVGVSGDAWWDGDAADLTSVALEALGSRLVVGGSVQGLASDPVFDVAVAVDALDLEGLDAVLGGVGLGGRWRGGIEAKGPLAAVGVRVVLDGIEGARGGLSFDGTADLGDPLSWQAVLTTRGLHAEDLYRPLAEMVPFGSVLRLDGRLDAKGSGTTWPDGLKVEAAFVGGAQEVFGLDFDRVELQATLVDGVLGLREVKTRGPLGVLGARGTLDLARGPMDLRAEGSFAPSELHRFGADGFGGAGWLSARVRGDLQAEVTRIRVDGSARVTDLTYLDGAVRVGHVASPIDVLLVGSEVTVRADVEASDATIYGVAVDAVRDPSVVVQVAADGAVTVTGEASADGVVMPGVFDVRSAAGPWAVALAADGAQHVEASLDLGAHRLVDTVAGTSGFAWMTLDDDLLGFQVELDDGARSMLATGGRFDLGAQSVVLDRLRFSPVADYAYTATRPVAFRLSEDGGIADADIALAGRGGDALRLTGRVGAAGPLDASLLVTGFDLGVLAALQPESLGHVSGRVTLGARLSGHASAFAVDGEVKLDGVFTPDQTAPVRIGGTYAAADERLVTSLHASVDGARLLTLEADVPVRLDLGAPGLRRDGELDLVADLRAGSLERVARLTGADVPVGVASGRLTVGGVLADPIVHVAAVVEARLENWTAPARIELSGHREDGVIAWWTDAYEGFARRAVTSGGATDRLPELIAWSLGEGPALPGVGISAYLPSVSLDAALTGFPVESVLALAGQTADATGRLIGDLKIRGSPDTPIVMAELGWVEGTLGEVEVENGVVRLEPTDDGYYVDLDLRAAGGELRIAGDVPLYLDLRKDPLTWILGDLGLRVSARGLPLAVLEAFVPEIRDASGVLFAEGIIEGTALAPRPAVALAIREGELAYLPLGVRYSQIELAALVTQDRARISRLSLFTEPLRPTAAMARGTTAVGGERRRPDLEFSGEVALAEWLPSNLDAGVKLNNFWVTAHADQLIRVGGEVKVSGAWPDLAITGRTEIASAFVRLDAAAFMEQGALEVDRRMVIRRGEEMPSVEVAAEEPPIWHQFDISVDIGLARNLEIAVVFPFLTSFGQLGASLTTANMGARLGGDLEFSMQDGQVRILGEVGVLDGRVTVLRSDFDLRDGTVRFLGDPSNPFLDLIARMEVGNTYLDMRVQGSAASPEMSFSSPDYASDSQVMTMLITGQEPQDLSPEQGQSATQMMTNLLLSSVLGGAKVGTVSFDADGTVRMGIPLGRAYAEAVYRLNPKLDENHYAVDFEVQLARRLVLDGVLGDRRSWFDLFWELRF